MDRTGDSLDGFREKFGEQLKCGICLDQYTQPRRLPCQHTFCLKCIERIPMELYCNSYCILCPICRKYVRLPPDGAVQFPPAYDLQHFIDLQKELTQRRSSNFYCEIHNDRLTVFCETCQKVICRDCPYSKEHADHKYRLIRDCYHEHRQVIEVEMRRCRADIDSLQRARRGLIDREKTVDKQKELLTNKLQAHSQKIIEQVFRYQEQLSIELGNVTDRKKEQLTNQREKIEKMEKEIQDGLQFNEHILREFSPEEVLKEKGEILKRMNHHIEARLLRPQVEADIVFNEFDIDMRTGIGELKYKKEEVGYKPPHAPGGDVPPSLPPNGDHPIRPIDPFAVFPPLKKDLPPHLVNPAPGSHPPVPIPRLADPQPPPLQPLPELKKRGRPVKTIPNLIHPSDVTLCDNGEIMITEYDCNRITVLSMEGVKIRSFRIEGSGDEEVYRPNGLASLNDGNILVTDLYRLQKITPNGACVKSVGGKRSGLLDRPKGIVVHPVTGDIFVADCTNNRVQVFTDQLDFKSSIKLPDGKYFKKPQDVAIDRDGHLYIAERDNHCITKLTTTGRYVTRFDGNASAFGPLKHPSSIALSDDNLLYVTEQGNHRVSVFDTHGRFLQVFGRHGNGEGELDQPFGIAIDQHTDNVYVTDYNNGRLVVF